MDYVFQRSITNIFSYVHGIMHGEIIEAGIIKDRARDPEDFELFGVI